MNHRWRIDRLSARLPEGPAGTYAIVLLWLACLMGLWLWGQGYGLRSMLLPCVCLVSILSRGRLFLGVLIVLLVLLDELDYFWSPSLANVSSLTEGWMCIPSMILIIGSLRYQAMVHRIFPSETGRRPARHEAAASETTRNETPYARDHATFDVSELWGLLALALVAFLVSGLIQAWLYSSEGTRGLSTVNPQVLLMAKLTLAAFVLFLLLHGLLGYLRLREMNDVESTMYLEHEWWRWCGSEQKRISRQRMRLRKRMKTEPS